MSLVKEHPVDFDHFLQTALKDQDALQVKVSLLWQRVVLLQTDEFLRQFSQTTSILRVSGDEARSTAHPVTGGEPPAEDRVDVESPCENPLSQADKAESNRLSCGSPADRLQECCRGYRAYARTVCSSLDSDATESSSGGESDEELEIPLKKRLSQPSLAALRVARAEYEEARVQLAARWGWILAQISDLDHRLRIQQDMYQRQRSLRRQFRFAHQSGRRNSMSSAASQSSPGSAENDAPPASQAGLQRNTSGEHAARAQPLPKFARRRLLRYPMSPVKTLHQAPVGSPALWYKQIYDPAASPKSSTASRQPTIMEKLDRSYHPVLSCHSDIPLSVCLESSIRQSEHRSNVPQLPPNIRRSCFAHAKKLKLHRTKGSVSRICDSPPPSIPVRRLSKKHSSISSTPVPSLSSSPAMFCSHKKSQDGTRRPKGISLTVDVRSNTPLRTPVRRSTESGQNTPTGTPQSAGILGRQPLSAKRQKRAHSSHDINDIVVQFSGAPRVTKLQYKKIETPRWRILDVMPVDSPMEDDDVEDISDEAFAQRHASLEASERIRFQGVDKKKRNNRSSSSVPTTPDAIATAPVSPAASVSLKSSPGDTPMEDAVPAMVLARKSSRKTTSLSRSTSSFGDGELLQSPAFAQPWEPRMFPLCEADMLALKEEQPSGRTSRPATVTSTNMPVFNRAVSLPVSLSASRSCSNAGSPSGANPAVLVKDSGDKVESDSLPHPSSWSVRTPSPKPLGKEVEESKPPLVLKLKKTGSTT